MKQIKPEDFSFHARKNWEKFKEDLSNSEKERIIINTYGCISKAFHSKIDELIDYINEFKKEPLNPKSEFPKKIEYVNESGLFSPEQLLLIDNLNNLRNNLEHRYQLPSVNEVKIYLKYLAMFLKNTEDFLKLPAKKVIELIDKSLKLLESKIKEKTTKKATIESYILQSKKFLYTYRKNPQNLTSKEANHYMTKIIEEKYTPRHIQHIEAILLFLYKSVLNKEWVKTVKRPVLKTKDHTLFDNEESKKILSFAPSLRDKLIIQVNYHAGLKSSQLVKLNIEDLSKLKLPDRLQLNLEIYLGNRTTGPVFVGQHGKRLGKRGIERLYEIISKKMGTNITTEVIRKNNPKIRYEFSQNNKRTRCPRSVVKEDEIITESELKQLMENANSELKKYYVYFIYHFGVGRKQFINIKFEDINFNKKIIKIKPAKHYNIYYIKLKDNVLNELKKFCKKFDINSGHLFSYSDDYISKLILFTGREIGIERKKLGFNVLANSQKFSELYNRFL